MGTAALYALRIVGLHHSKLDNHSISLRRLLTGGKARTIYRMVEFSQPLDGSINHSEAYFYALEALPIFISVVLFNVWHPGKVLVGPRSDFKSDPAQSVRMEGILVDEEQVRR